jgi:hypothetical protein
VQRHRPQPLPPPFAILSKLSTFHKSDLSTSPYIETTIFQSRELPTMSKASAQSGGPPTYRDDPDHAETASMASAVLLDDVDSFPDEELPSYTDTPGESHISVTPNLSLSDNYPRFYQYVLLSPHNLLTDPTDHLPTLPFPLTTSIIPNTARASRTTLLKPPHSQTSSKNSWSTPPATLYNFAAHIAKHDEMETKRRRTRSQTSPSE